jgi:hypothetical protein
VTTTRLAVVLCLVVTAASCKKQELPARHFYDQQIQPIFENSCANNTSGCHRIDPATGTAAGNLDLSSFEGVQRRRDVLRTYGPYPQPLLLLKALREADVLIAVNGKLAPSEIRHAGAKPLSPNSDAFYELKRWLDNGATRDGLPQPLSHGEGQGGCATVTPQVNEMVDRGSDAYRTFVSDVQPILKTSCAYGTCHSAQQADFYLTCGDNDGQRDANFLRVASFVVDKGTDVEQSEFLLRPLDPRAGGISHTGGVFYASRDDGAWKKLRDWARKAQDALPAPAAPSAGETFFGANVMPLLIRRGCALEGCHSPNGFNDFRLRPGGPGNMSREALHRNYETSLTEFMSLDSPDVRQSRLVKKNLFPGSGGIPHRGGPLLDGDTPMAAAPIDAGVPDDGGAAPAPAPAPMTGGCPPYDPATATALCTLTEWHRLERLDHAADVSAGAVLPLAFVSRPPDGDHLVEFDTFRGGADLRLADAHLDRGGHVTAVDNARSALGPCMGLTAGPELDVRGPEWSYDGNQLVFAARMGAAGGLDLWVLDVAAKSCRRLSDDNGRQENGVRVHNFDPAFAPDGSLVFASTRAGTLTLKRLLPNADLYRVGPGLDFGGVERMTWLLNSELSPAFMQNGQLSFTAEKATADFYQLSGRRMNWDLTDYHPLLAQRAQSDNTFGKTHPSVGYQRATEIREGLDRNFLVILSDANALGAGGALATFNRSVGPFEEGRNDRSFLHSLLIVDGAATGRAGTQGVYRSPYPLLDGEILASYAPMVTDPAADVPRYDLVAIPGTGGSPRTLLSGGGQSFVEPALGYKRSGRLLFRNLPQLVFGGHGAGSGDKATVHFPDLPMLATLLGANLRRGRNVAAYDKAAALKVYEELPPSSASPDQSLLLGSEHVFTQRRPLGQAKLEFDGSVKVTLPASKPLILEVVDGSGKALFTMSEEHQLGPGESISPGVSRKLFNGICAGCHGSVSGNELDVAVTPDVLTGASGSASRDMSPKTLQ